MTMIRTLRFYMFLLVVSICSAHCMTKDQTDKLMKVLYEKVASNTNGGFPIVIKNIDDYLNKNINNQLIAKSIDQTYYDALSENPTLKKEVFLNHLKSHTKQMLEDIKAYDLFLYEFNRAFSEYPAVPLGEIVENIKDFITNFFYARYN